MPSNHAQFMGFFVAFSIMVVSFRLKGYHPAERLAVVAGSLALGLLVCHSRLVFGFHTVPQVRAHEHKSKQAHKHTKANKHTSTQTHKHTNKQTNKHKHTNTQTHKTNHQSPITNHQSQTESEREGEREKGRERGAAWQNRVAEGVAPRRSRWGSRLASCLGWPGSRLLRGSSSRASQQPSKHGWVEL